MTTPDLDRQLVKLYQELTDGMTKSRDPRGHHTGLFSPAIHPTGLASPPGWHSFSDSDRAKKLKSGRTLGEVVDAIWALDKEYKKVDAKMPIGSDLQNLAVTGTDDPSTPDPVKQAATAAGVSSDQATAVGSSLLGSMGLDFSSLLAGKSTLTDADLESLTRRAGGFDWTDKSMQAAFGMRGQDVPNTFWESGSSQPTWRGVDPIITDHAKFGDASANAVEHGLAIINQAKNGSQAYSLRQALAKPYGLDDGALQAAAEKLWLGGYLQNLKIDVTKPFGDQYRASAFDPAFQGAWKAWIESSFMDRSKSATAILEDRIAKNAPVLAKVRQQAVDDKVKDAMARVNITDPARLRALADRQGQDQLGHGLNVADQQALADWYSSKEMTQVQQAVAGKPTVALDAEANLQEKVRADHGAEAEALDQAEVFSMFRSLLGPGGGR